MYIWEKIRGNPLEKMKIRTLRTEDIRLSNRVSQIKREIDKNEKEKRKLFQQGIGADTIKKRILAQELVGLDMESKLKLKNFTTVRRQLMFIKNILVIKNYEKELKNSGIWKKITTLSREHLENFLIGIKLEGKEFDEVLNELNQPFEMEVAEIEGEEIKENEKKLFDAWDKVETGSIEATEAESEFSIEREFEKEEAEED